MKPLTVTLALLAAFAAGGLLTWTLAPAPQGAAEAEREPLYWVAPMDPNYRRDQPGKSPMGMDLVPVYAEDEAPAVAGTVRIDPTVVNNLGVRTGEARRETLTRPIETVGFVQFDEQKLVHFHSRVQGWIEALSVTAVGDPVEKGQKLFELYSPELVNAQEEYLAALRAGNRALVAASERRLRFLGVGEEQIGQLRRTREVIPRLPFHAGESGYVATLNVREGSFITPDTEVLSVGSLDTVWVIGEVFERQAAWLAPGQPVTMTTDSYPGERWRGQVDYIYPVLDPATRTLRTRVVFANPDGRLKPNMFATLNIATEPLDNVLTVPASAVIPAAGGARVVKALGDGRFRAVPVRLGLRGEGRVQVLAGLAAGDTVVTAGQFLLDSESNVAAEMERMSATDQSMDHSGMDHNGMEQDTRAGGGMDAGGMDHDAMQDKQMDHSQMNHGDDHDH